MTDAQEWLWLGAADPSIRVPKVVAAMPSPALSPFQLGDEEDLGAWAERLEIGGLVESAIDRDGGFFFEMVSQARVELVHRFDDPPQVLGLDRELAHPAGVAAAKAGGEDDACGHRLGPFCGPMLTPTLTLPHQGGGNARRV